MYRSSLETEIGYLLGDPQHRRWPTAKLRPRIQIAQEQIQAITGAVKTTTSLTLTVDTAEVQISDSVIDVTRATLQGTDGDVHVLIGRSRNDLDFYIPNWLNDSSGKPIHYFYDQSNRNLVLYPKPSSDYIVSNGLKVWEVRVPGSMTGDASEPFDANSAMQSYAMSLVHWVVAQCFQDDGTSEALVKARFHRSNDIDKPGETEKYIKLINGRFNAPTGIPSRIKWSPQGGRIGGGRFPTKSYPLG